MSESFDITWRNGAYYVSIPNYQGGTVYTADYVEKLRAQLADSQSQLVCMQTALVEVWRIVHVPSKATNFRKAQDHFMADFEAIRKTVKPALTDDLIKGDDRAETADR